MIDFKKYIRSGKSASDITPLLADDNVFKEVIDTLCDYFSDISFDKVIGIEARGFVLASAVAYKLGKGFIPVRKEGKLHNETVSSRFIDYSKKEKVLEMHKDALSPGQKVLIIDDWVETGAAIKAAIELVEQLNAHVVGVGVLMDDSTDEVKHFLKKHNYKYIEKTSPGDKF